MTKSLRNRRGFSLVELLVATTIGGIAMAALLSCFVFLARNFTRLANYQALQGESRTALAYLQADLAQARSVKAGTTPTTTQLALALPAGEVTYTFDPATLRLRRQATFGGMPDRYLFAGAQVRCTSFAFNYYTGSSGAPVAQLDPATNIPFSVKQLAVSFVLQTSATTPKQTAARYAVVSPRWQLRNKRSPDGT